MKWVAFYGLCLGLIAFAILARVPTVIPAMILLLVVGPFLLTAKSDAKYRIHRQLWNRKVTDAWMGGRMSWDGMLAAKRRGPPPGWPEEKEQRQRFDFDRNWIT